MTRDAFIALLARGEQQGAAALSLTDLRSLVEGVEDHAYAGDGTARRVLDLLRTRREADVAAARAIHDKASAASRGLLASEQRDFDRLTAAARDLKPWIDRVTNEIDRQARLPDTIARSLPRLDESSRETTMLLRPDQRMASVARRRGPVWGDDYSDVRDGDLCLGRILRRMVMGGGELTEAERRALSEADGPSAGFLVPPVLATEVIDRARNAARVIQAGARTVPMETESVTVPRLISSDMPQWKGENAPMSESSMEFGTLTLSARTLPMLVKLSIELFEDAKPESLRIIDHEIGQQLGLALDLAALRGTGGLAPLGIRNWASHGVTIRELGAGNGATIDNYDPIIDAVGDVLAQNGSPNAYLLPSRTAVALAKLKDSQNLPLPRPPLVEQLAAHVTNQIPTNLTVGTSNDCTEVYVADWTKLIFGIRTSFRIEAFRGAGDAVERMQVWIRAYLRADVMLAIPQHFCVLTGVRS